MVDPSMPNGEEAFDQVAAGLGEEDDFGSDEPFPDDFPEDED